MCVQGEIDAREDSFKSLAEAGQFLMESDHYAVDDVKQKLVELANEKTSLLELWEERRVLYEQCMDLQIFHRDTEQADAWMSKQEVRRRVCFTLTAKYSALARRDFHTCLILCLTGIPGERGPGRLAGQRRGADEEARGLREITGGAGGEDQSVGRVRLQAH